MDGGVVYEQKVKKQQVLTLFYLKALFAPLSPSLWLCRSVSPSTPQPNGACALLLLCYLIKYTRSTSTYLPSLLPPKNILSKGISPRIGAAREQSTFFQSPPFSRLTQSDTDSVANVDAERLFSITPLPYHSPTHRARQENNKQTSRLCNLEATICSPQSTSLFSPFRLFSSKNLHLLELYSASQSAIASQPAAVLIKEVDGDDKTRHDTRTMAVKEQTTLRRNYSHLKLYWLLDCAPIMSPLLLPWPPAAASPFHSPRRLALGFIAFDHPLGFALLCVLRSEWGAGSQPE